MPSVRANVCKSLKHNFQLNQNNRGIALENTLKECRSSSMCMERESSHSTCYSVDLKMQGARNCGYLPQNATICIKAQRRNIFQCDCLSMHVLSPKSHIRNYQLWSLLERKWWLRYQGQNTTFHSISSLLNLLDIEPHESATFFKK